MMLRLAKIYLEEMELVKDLGDKTHKLALTSVAVSPDSKRVYTAAKDAGIVVWDLESGAKLFKIPGGRKGQQSLHPGHCSAVLAMAVSSDNKLLASGDSLGHVRLFGFPTINDKSEFDEDKPTSGPVLSTKFFADDSYVIVVGGLEAGLFKYKIK